MGGTISRFMEATWVKGIKAFGDSTGVGRGSSKRVSPPEEADFDKFIEREVMMEGGWREEEIVVKYGKD